MFCSNCGSETNEDDKFCSKCGKEKGSTLDKVPDVRSRVLEKTDIHKTYNFARSKYFLGYTAVRYCTIYTDITIDNSVIQVKQWKSSFFKKYARNNQTIAAEDLQAVTIEKVYSWGWIVYAIICIAGGLLNPLLWLFALVALLFLKRKKIYVFHKTGRIHIPDEGNGGMEKIKDMVAQFKRLNPNINILSIDDKA